MRPGNKSSEDNDLRAASLLFVSVLPFVFRLPDYSRSGDGLPIACRPVQVFRQGLRFFRRPGAILVTGVYPIDHDKLEGKFPIPLRILSIFLTNKGTLFYQ
jgi:hypothetical protein